jgi:23S rRNA (adenine-N6)-dimethyltransferase
MRNRIKYSQNFLKNNDLVHSLIEKSSISVDDVVFEIGAGEGIITKQLANKARKVIAFEIDGNLSHKLTETFTNKNLVEVVNQDFLQYELPKYDYKVFSNIPFNLTANIIKKLTFSNNPSKDSYLIVQKEAAQKFIGKPIATTNSLVSVLIQSRFETSIFHEFRKDDFFPRPMVDTVMVRFQKLETPKVLVQDIDLFYDFVTFGFNQFAPNISKGLSKVLNVNAINEIANTKHFSISAKPSQLDIEAWVALFEKFKLVGNKSKVLGGYKRMLAQQNSLEKINRTRLDKNWKNKAST